MGNKLKGQIAIIATTKTNGDIITRLTQSTEERVRSMELQHLVSRKHTSDHYQFSDFFISNISHICRRYFEQW